MAESGPRTVLNHLIETCRDAEKGFRHAADIVADPSLKSVFTNFADRRAQFASDLLPQAQRLGGAADADGTTGASMHRHWMDLRNALSGHDDSAVLVEVKRGDHVTLLAFKAAVDGALPGTVRDLIEQQYAEVREAHERIEGLERARQEA